MSPEQLARYRPVIFKFCLKLTRTVDEAEDLTQATFVKAILDAWQFRGGHERQVKSWLFRIAMRKFLDGIRSGQKRTFQPFRSGIDDPVTELDPFGSDLFQAIMEHIECLGLDERMMLAMKVDGYSEIEIAAYFGIKVGTVKSRYHSTQCKLRKAITGGKIDGTKAA